MKITPSTRLRRWTAIGAGAIIGAAILAVSGCRSGDDTTAAEPAGSPPAPPAGAANAPQVSPEVQAKIDAWKRADIAARAAHLHDVNVSTATRRPGQ